MDDGWGVMVVKTMVYVQESLVDSGLHLMDGVSQEGQKLTISSSQSSLAKPSQHGMNAVGPIQGSINTNPQITARCLLKVWG